MKILLKTIFFFFIINQLIYVLAQDKNYPDSSGSRYSLNAAVGVNDFHINDEYLSSEILRGILFSANLSFQISSLSGAHEIDIFYTTGKPEYNDETWNFVENAGYFSYEYTHHLKSINLINNQLKISAGGGISSFVMSSELRRKNPYNGEILFFDQSWYWSHNLNLIIGSCYNFGIHNLSLKLGVPLYKIVTRPENGHNLNQNNSEVIKDTFLNAAGNGKSEFFWNNLLINFKLNYRFPLNENLDFKVKYLFSYVSADKPEPLEMGMYMNSLLFGLELNF